MEAISHQNDPKLFRKTLEAASQAADAFAKFKTEGRDLRGTVTEDSEGVDFATFYSKCAEYAKRASESLALCKELWNSIGGKGEITNSGEPGGYRLLVGGKDLIGALNALEMVEFVGNARVGRGVQFLTWEDGIVTYTTKASADEAKVQLPKKQKAEQPPSDKQLEAKRVQERNTGVKANQPASRALEAAAKKQISALKKQDSAKATKHRATILERVAETARLVSGACTTAKGTPCPKALGGLKVAIEELNVAHEGVPPNWPETAASPDIEVWTHLLKDLQATSFACPAMFVFSDELEDSVKGIIRTALAPITPKFVNAAAVAEERVLAENTAFPKHVNNVVVAEAGAAPPRMSRLVACDSSDDEDGMGDAGNGVAAAAGGAAAGGGGGTPVRKGRGRKGRVVISDDEEDVVGAGEESSMEWDSSSDSSSQMEKKAAVATAVAAVAAAGVARDKAVASFAALPAGSKRPPPTPASDTPTPGMKRLTPMTPEEKGKAWVTTALVAHQNIVAQIDIVERQDGRIRAADVLSGFSDVMGLEFNDTNHTAMQSALRALDFLTEVHGTTTTGEPTSWFIRTRGAARP